MSSIQQPIQQTPTAQQLASRQVVSRELPTFTGDPIDWPIFSSSYFHSTQMCGYNDSENLLRLQRSLKGCAKYAVSSFLLHPSTVPQILSTLQILYGRPEQIVHNMIAKVRATPAPKADRLDTLVAFGLVVQNLCCHLKAVGLNKHLSNPTLLQELVDKLPATVKFSWALYQEQLSEVDLNTFGEYMAKIVSATSSITLSSVNAHKASREDRPKSKENAYFNTHRTTEQDEFQFQDGNSADDQDESSEHCLVTVDKKVDSIRRCPVCDAEGHQTGNCFAFKRLSIDDRWKLVKEKKLCRRCLTQHTRWPCKGEICGIKGCQIRHHRLLHTNIDQIEHKPSEPTANATLTIHRQLATLMLFRILPVTLHGCRGSIETFAFLDDGSSVTLVNESIADALGLEGNKESLCIHWTSGIKKQLDTRRVELEISSASNSKRFIASEVYTVENLGLPEQTLDYNEMAKRYHYLKNLPVKSYKAAVPGILIGLNNIHLLATLKLREGRRNEPIATKTRIGWAVYGSLRGGEVSLQHRQMHICGQTSNEELHDYVRRFFSIESLGVAVVPKIEGVEDQRARRILQETTRRTESGRFQTGLLWKHDYVELPDSKPMAEKRHICLEKRLAKNSELHDNVRKQIAEFQMKGYAHKATAAELKSFDPRRTWYLPIGVVLNPKKPDKVRLIWDAAAKVDGISLNTMLLKGPDLLTPLLSVLFKYREREVAICADIKEMFHQILIRKEDRSAQLFLWRDSPDLPLDTMVADVAIFGATCSPTHSQHVKNTNATENEIDHPKAAVAIREKHYVDDYLDSVDTLDEAVEIALQVAKVHAKAGFHIRNWMSNKLEVMERIDEVQMAERSLWRMAQSDAYPDEVVILNRNLNATADKQKRLENSSSILKLSPVLDEYGVLRVDGRTEAADDVPHDAKYPIILPKKHRVTELLLDWYHRHYRHANDETVVNEVRQKFQIPELRVQVRSTKKRCMWCRVYKATPRTPRMGPLPRVRLTPFLRPFTFVGIDYFGPYLIKIGRCAVKRWVALFTCLTIRAVHLEVAANLSSDSCKKAIRRFIARRGAPKIIHSDNGTNFTGANRELEEEKRKINKELSSTFTDANTQWRFNPPSAPHMGGCWERMVRSVKVALGSLPIERKLDEESLETMLAEAEHMVNSRPLTFVPLETAHHESLSPNHFLMLSSSGVQQAIKDPVDEQMSLQDSWNMIQHTLDKFWRRWIIEYLPTITRRTKWFQKMRDIKEGDLVVIADEKMRNHWIRGRVVHTYPGRDGTVRQAGVLISGEVFKRPVAKLALLDVDDPEA